MNIIRVGRGRSKTGKILDRDTKWFTWNAWSDPREEAIQYAIESKLPIFVSMSQRVYREITPDELRNTKLHPKIIIGT